VLAALAGCGGANQPSPRPSPQASASPGPTPRTDVAAVAARATVPVLCYHQIRKPTAADSARDRTYIVRPSVFAEQMRALAAAGYTTITGEALADHVARGARLPRKPILLTFDDGSAGQYTHALPVLREHRFVATFFVMTVVLGKPGWLTRGQVRKLDEAGMTIGAHTYDHKAVPEYGGEDWETQLEQPGRELRRLLGHPVRLFAYPFGAYSSEAIQHLWSAGYRVGFQLAERLDHRHPLWSVRRIIVPELSGRELVREIRRDF
jgi:peptidoglycan/xylan/chitin deacetylase (PgdA/CDA1 family)